MEFDLLLRTCCWRLVGDWLVNAARRLVEDLLLETGWGLGLLLVQETKTVGEGVGNVAGD